MEKGVFTISIDFESAWGYADYALSDSDKERITDERDIVSRLLDLFEKYNIPATWAVVGHLIDRGCPWDGDKPHPEYPPLVYSNNEVDWFKDHPKQHDYSSELWYDTSNHISRIRHGNPKHEVASHSYAHIVYDEKHTLEDAVKADLKNLGRVHRVHDVPLTSFVFPRNIEGYYRHLKLNGFTTYRGNSPKWYDNLNGSMKRLAHLIDFVFPEGRTVLPDTKKFGLVNIPDSMLLIGRNGIRNFIFPDIIVQKAIRGLKKAKKDKEIFHLWFHPSNFSHKTDEQFEIFEKILKQATDFRNDGSIEILTMQQIAGMVLADESDNS